MNRYLLISILSLNFMGFFYLGTTFTYAQVGETGDLDSRVKILEEQIKNENQLINELKKKEDSISKKKTGLQNIIEEEKQRLIEIDKRKMGKEFRKQQEQKRLQGLEKAKQQQLFVQKEKEALGEQKSRQVIQHEMKDSEKNIAQWLAREKQQMLSRQETPEEKRVSCINAWLDKLDTKFRKVVW